MTIRVIIVGLGQVGMFYDLSPDNSNFINSHAKAFLDIQDLIYVVE